MRFRAYQPEKGASNVPTRTKAEARTNKERARKVLILNMDFQLRQHYVKNMAIPGDQTIGIPAYLKIPLVELAEALLHGTTQDILHG